MPEIVKANLPTPRDEAASGTLRSGLVVFTIDTELYGMSYKSVRIMQNLAEPTGGKSFNQVGGRDVAKGLCKY
jgi:hypothetical protein